MQKIFTLIKIILIVATATFVSFHTVIFIKSIEPNPILAWILAAVIEGFLITLAIQKTIMSKVLLIPLFIISVIASSASFVIKNEDSLNQFLNLKVIKQAEAREEELQKKSEEQRQKAIKQLLKDIAETQEQMKGLNPKYLTKTLERERKLKDLLLQKMGEEGQQVLPLSSHQTIHVIDYLTPYRAVIFFVIVFVLQSVSLYTASHLKNGLSFNPSTANRNTKPMLQNHETVTQNSVTDTPNRNIKNMLQIQPVITENSVTDTSIRNIEPMSTEDKNTIARKLKHLKKSGVSLATLSQKTGLSRMTISRAINYPSTYVSDEVFLKIMAGLDGNF